MNISTADFRKELDSICETLDTETGIVVQCVLNLAITAHCNGQPLAIRQAQKVLALRIARHRAAPHVGHMTLH